MAPPPGGAIQPHQPRGLRGHAVDGHLLLLLAQRVQEAERVHAEPQHAHERDRHQCQPSPQRHARALPRVRTRRHQERQGQSRRQLDAHACGQRPRARAQSGARPAGSGRKRQRGRQREHQQRVVVCSADAQHERHRVQPHERRGPLGRVPKASCRPRNQPHRSEAAEHRDRLERPQRPRDPERHERIADHGEQRSVRRPLKAPADEVEHPVGGRFRGHVRVRIQTVERTQARVGDVPEDVLGEQRRPQQQDHVGRHNRARQHPPGQAPRRGQYQQVAGAHDQHQRLEARAGQAQAESPQRSGQPRRPATAARRHVLRGRRRGTGADQEHKRPIAPSARTARADARVPVVRPWCAGLRGASAAGDLEVAA
jgi:hypothetical protein